MGMNRVRSFFSVLGEGGLLKQNHEEKGIITRLSVHIHNYRIRNFFIHH